MFARAKGKQYYRVRNNVLIISYITFRDCRVHIFADNLSTMQTSLDKLDMFSNLTSLFFAVSINIPLKINCRGSILTFKVTFEPTYFQELVLRIWRASSGLSAFLIM